MHHSTQHTGKVPLRKGGATSKVLSLRQELDRAVALEEYEQAAVLRDQIKALETSEDAAVVSMQTVSHHAGEEDA